MIDPAHDLSITKQAETLNISRGSVYYLPRPSSAADLEVMRRLDRLHLEFPFAGSPVLGGLLAGGGGKIARRHVNSADAADDRPPPAGGSVRHARSRDPQLAGRARPTGNLPRGR